MLMTFEDVEPSSPIELTRDEMLAISAEISLKYSPDKTTLAGAENRPPVISTHLPQAAILSEQATIQGFSHRELQAISQDISQRYAPKTSNTVPELLLLPVDPYHLYAFWDTGAGVSQSMIAADTRNSWTLRVYWRPEAAKENIRSNIWFDIPADSPAKRKKIRLPIDGTYYYATFGKMNRDHSLEVLAQSNLVHVPTAPNRRRLALSHPATDMAAKEPAFAVRHLQGILNATQQAGGYFPEGWSIKLHPTSSANPIGGPAKIFSELMNIFKINRIDAELIPGPELQVETENLPGHASGFGL